MRDSLKYATIFLFGYLVLGTIIEGIAEGFIATLPELNGIGFGIGLLCVIVYNYSKKDISNTES